jgi:transcriptional regulator with XRE-family HTH domain
MSHKDDHYDGSEKQRKRKGRGLASHNPLPDAEPPHPHSPDAQIKRDFASRLSAFMLKKGWNQSELARQAALHMPSGQFNRDNISNYKNAKHTPGPVHTAALCKALGVEPIDLFPSGSAPSSEDATPPLDVRDLGDGTVFVRLNQRLPWEKALQILQIAKGE